MIVDDSPTVRGWLSFVIDRDPRLRVVGQAANAQEARSVIKAAKPHVVTLDLEMPHVNGLEFLSHLMRLHPLPVVVFSSLVQQRRQVARAALRLGAAACVPKPTRPDPAELSNLCDQIADASTLRYKTAQHHTISKWPEQIVLIGASTGGVAAIETVLRQFDQNSPPVVVAQHMPQRFLESFAQRLDRLVSLDVQLAERTPSLARGTVHLATAQDHQTAVAWSGDAWGIELTPREMSERFCPSVNALFTSAVPWAPRVGAMLLTGLGDDGAAGMLSLLQAGARTVGQSPQSCVVYGMPGAAHTLGAVEVEVDIGVAGETMLRMLEI
ncbi:chemotaxis protein CheB [Tateyamaria sp. SN6-1]|uniref:chemotaxis protein CheB n=1 Tax=Tateyamaria sp. SN6-1 TaxID=3092148 RepID=UPI0039F619B5